MQISFDSLPNFYILLYTKIKCWLVIISRGYIFNNNNKIIIMAGVSRGSLVIKSVIK